jgi:cyclopropane fatty-acyl-phospholipid synthase-like methyltransferase
VPVDYQIYICELVFGTNDLLPGGAARKQALTNPLMLKEGINGLDLSAGIGGMMYALREKSGLYLTLMEGNPDVAAAAMARMAERPEAEQRDIIAYSPATLDLGALKYDWAVSREMLFHIPDKLGFLNKLQKSMYNGGQIILTDLALPDDADPNDANLALWRDAEAHPIHPITVSQYRALLEDANMEVLDFENDTESCANDIRQAWSKFTETMQAQSIDPAFQQHILHEAEYWHSRLRAFDSGALRLLRIRAVHRAPAQA